MLLLASMLVAQAPAQAQDPLGFDIRCMVVLQAASDDMSGDMAATFQSGALFYFGRVDGQLQGQALEQRVVAEVEALSEADMPALIRACGEFMEQRGEAMMALGERIEAVERARAID